jgi:isocitrate lyase|tara:strand:+ start:157 stop:1467 length:1311 start_codon:yes stop_codon:yes gene_type:complete
MSSAETALNINDQNYINTSNKEIDSRWNSLERLYSPRDVQKLRGTVNIEYSLARQGAEKLWKYLNEDDFVQTFGVLTGNQAVQHAKAGLKAVYISGWQVAADANTSGNTYPDQSLYPVDSVPTLVKRINSALLRADQVETMERFENKGVTSDDRMLPILADAESGFGGPLNVFELMKAMIEAGAAGVHFEDQLSSEKKCGHMGGKVLVPTQTQIRTLNSARLAADVMNVPTLIFARTDANAANLITSDIDEYDKPFITGERTIEGFYKTRPGLDQAIARGLAYAPYADLIWCETAKPDLDEAKRFADAIHKKYPDKLLAYNCSPSFNWKKNLDKDTMKIFQSELGKMGYKFQFITLAGFHLNNYATFKLAQAYKQDGMAAYSELQEAEFAAEKDGYTSTKHQREAGTSYFDAVSQALTQGKSSTVAMEGSTEEDQF